MTPKPQPAPKPVPVKPVRPFNVKETLAAADSKLNGIGIVQYIDSKMGEDERRSPEIKKQNADESKNVPDVKPVDTENRRGPSSREVIQTVETLNETYSVMKQLRANEKQTQDQPTSQAPQTQLPSNQAKVQAFLHQGGPISYAIEGTPVEMSRCTSLSNLTMDSGPDTYDFGALQRKMADRRKSPPQEKSTGDDVTPKQNDGENSAGDDANKKSGDVKKSVTSQDSVGDESKVILDDIDRQIQNLTVDTATSRAGYVTSLPVGDEIKKFQVEGSVGAFTNFSALTVDSETKIAPCQPYADHQAGAAPVKQPPPGVAPESNKPDVFEEAFEEAAEEIVEQVIPDPARHYGEDRSASRDRPLSFKVSFVVNVLVE